MKLIVREDIGEGKDQLYEKEQILPGSYAIFNLDQEQSKLYVGGYPSSFQIQNQVTASSFEGEMEELVVGDIPTSFWNFVDGENNIQGAYERDKLINYQPSTGYRFDTNGYAILSKKASQIPVDGKKFSIKLKVKTFSEDGLIYLMGKGNKYLSLEMKNGNIVYQFNLGEGEITLRSPEKYNDGKWHTVEALRLERIGVLKVNDNLVKRNEMDDGNNTILVSSDHIYFGGYPPHLRHPYKSVTHRGFEGCIDDVTILETSVDLTRNTQAFGVMPGCPARFSSLVSFDDSNPGYVKWDNASASNILQINLKFKTLAENGLIFYVIDEDQTVASSLSLVNGLLVFNSMGEELRTSSTGIRFSDNEWHVVTATHNTSSLRLDIDDTQTDSTETAPPALNIQRGNLYIGGLPNTLRKEESTKASSDLTTPFIGCIGDATLNGMIINFANIVERPHALIGKCKNGEGCEFFENFCCLLFKFIYFTYFIAHLPPIETDTLAPIPTNGPDDFLVNSTQSSKNLFHINLNVKIRPDIQIFIT